MKFTKNDIIKIGNQMAECTFDENGYVVGEDHCDETTSKCDGCNKEAVIQPMSHDMSGIYCNDCWEKYLDGKEVA